MIYSLINTFIQVDSRVTGNWIQDCHGTLADATKSARDTEKVNSNKIVVSVVPYIGFSQVGQHVVEATRLDR